MEARAELKHVRISPRKVKVVFDLIRGKNLGDALAIVRTVPKAACPIIEKMLKSAAANSQDENKNMDATKLFVAECYACPGPTLKRIMPRAKGSADRILKRTSHLTVVLRERED